MEWELMDSVKWELVPTEVVVRTIGEALTIIDEALMYGFEFIVENHNIYWKEI